MKIMSSMGSFSASEVESFKQEIRFLGALQHPRIVQLLGACMAPPNLCLVEDLAIQGSLYDLLHVKSRGKGLPYAQVTCPLSCSLPMCKLLKPYMLGS